MDALEPVGPVRTPVRAESRTTDNSMYMLVFSNGSAVAVMSNDPRLHGIPMTQWVPEVPSEVTRAQAWVAMSRFKLPGGGFSLLFVAQQLVDAMPVDAEARIWFYNASVYKRDAHYLTEVAAEIGLSSEQIDSLFITAHAIEA